MRGSGVDLTIWACAARCVARRDDHREPQMELVLIKAQVLQIGDLDRHRCLGADIGDFGTEHVGPVLFDQRGAFSGTLGFLVYLAGFLLFLDLGDDLFVAGQ